MISGLGVACPLKAKILVAYFLIYVVWGSTYFFIGIALRELPPFLLGTIRFTAAGLLLLMWACSKGEMVFKKSLIGRSAVSGVVLLFIDMGVIMFAQQYLSSSLVAILASSTAIWMLVLDLPKWKDNFGSTVVIVGVVTGFAGVVLLFAEQLNLHHFHPKSGYGVVLMICGCISWAVGSLYTKYHSSREEPVSAFSGSAWQMIFAGIAFLCCSLFNGDISRFSIASVSFDVWLSLAYLVLFGSIFSYSAYIWLLKVRSASEVGTHAFVNPVIAVLFGSGFGNEQVSLIQLLGLAIIILSIVLIGKKRPDQSVSL